MKVFKRVRKLMVVCVFCSDEHLTLFPGFSLLLQEKTLAGHVDFCVNKFWSGGRSSTKSCGVDNEILSGVGRKILLQNGT